MGTFWTVLMEAQGISAHFLLAPIIHTSRTAASGPPSFYPLLQSTHPKGQLSIRQCPSCQEVNVSSRKALRLSLRARLSIAVALPILMSAIVSAPCPAARLLANNENVPPGLNGDEHSAAVRAGTRTASPPEFASLAPGMTSADRAPVPEDIRSTDPNPMHFPFAVAVSGDRAVIGAEWQDGFRGAAYVLRRDGAGWIVEQRISPESLSGYDRFGGSVAIEGKRIVIGAPWQDLMRGAAYVFELENGRWAERSRLYASDGWPRQEFGRKVSIIDRVVTVEAGPDGAKNGNPIAFYRFEQSDEGWVPSGKEWKPFARNAPPQALSAERTVASGIIDLAALVNAGDERPPLRVMTPPPSPAWVHATDGAFEDRVEISWAAVASDAIVYMVMRDGELISVVSSDETQYSDQAGNLNTVYDYCVVTKDMAEQESAPVCDQGSRIIFAPIGEDPQFPDRISASDGEFVDRVEIRWVDISAINTGYAIRRDGIQIGTAGPNAGMFADRVDAAEFPPVPEVRYNYEVVAIFGEWQSAAASDSGWVGVIPPPLNVAATDGQYNDRVRVTWQGPAFELSGYRIYRDGALIDSTDAPATTYDDFAVVAGVTYSYCVATKVTEAGGVPEGVLKSGRGAGDESIRVCDEGCIGLRAPDAVHATEGEYDDRVRVTWEDRTDFEDGYEIRRGVGAADPVVLDTTRVNAESYDDLTAIAGTVYAYHVRAVNRLGGVSGDRTSNGYRSFVLAPTDVTATEGTFEDYVEVTWSSTATTAVLFKILRDGILIKSVSSEDRLYRDYGGTAGRAYEYDVVAVTALEDEARAMGTREAGH